MDITKLRLYLQQALLEYRGARPNLSLRAIARSSGVNRYFLKKILENTDSDQAPPLDLQQVMILAKFISDRRVQRESTESQTPLWKTLESFSTQASENKVSQNLSDKNFHFHHSFEFFIIYHLLMGEPSLNGSIFHEILGARSKKILEHLLQSHQIIEDQGQYRWIGEPVPFKKEFLALYASELLKFFGVFSSNQRGHLQCHVKALNKEALSKIQDIQNEASQKIEKIFLDPESTGSVPTFSISCQDTLMES